jgi:glycosyltransferase involved in cell wall biosynthesis
MNILFISSIQMWGGGEVFLMDIMRGMKERGHTVSVLCRPKTELAKNAKKIGFNVITIRIAGDFDPFVIWNASRIMKKNKIDVICTNMDKDLRFGGLAAKLAGVKGIIPSREIDYPLKDTFRYRFIYNHVATHLVVNSEATKNTVIKSAPWFDPQRMTVIYKGISLESFDALPASNLADEIGVPPATKFITFVGQLDERKGIRYLLDAWKDIHSRHTDVMLLLIGKGPMQKFIETFIVQHSLKSSVRLLGFRNDIPAILQQSYLLTLPSLWEGFGYVLVEAMAAKLPTVATATSSIPEIVVHEKTGLLVPPRQSKALAEAFNTLISDPEKAHMMGEAGRIRMEELFTIDVMFTKFEKVFQCSQL